VREISEVQLLINANDIASACVVFYGFDGDGLAGLAAVS